MSHFFTKGGQIVGASAFSISSSSEYSGLISFRFDWFDVLAVHGTLKVSPSTTVQRHQLFFFFLVWLSHSYMTIGKITALTIWTFVGQVMSLLFNMLPRFVIAFLPRSKRLNFMAAVTILSDFGACFFHCLPIYLP